MPLPPWPCPKARAFYGETQGASRGESVDYDGKGVNYDICLVYITEILLHYNRFFNVFSQAEALCCMRGNAEMLNIVILEDRVEQAQRLTQMLRDYAVANGDFAYSLTVYDRSIPLLTEYKCDADILFLDIQVPDMLGMEVARRIRQMDDRVMIIFITMLTQYAIEGYSVGAFDYVLKPVRFEEFSTKMDRARRMLAHQNTSMTLEVRTKEEIRRLNVDEISFIEVSNHDILIHTDSETIRQWGNLKSYEDKLAPAHFIRCSASFLVNLKYVRAVNGASVTVGGQELPLSNTRRKEFLAALAQYKGGSR